MAHHRSVPVVRFVAPLAACLVLAAVSTCRVHYSGVFTPPRPILVTAEPPAAPPEEKPEAPYPGAVWIEGHHEWTAEGWVWLPGSYVRPRTGHRWVSPRYEHAGPRMRYVPGYWEPSPAGEPPPSLPPPPAVLVPGQSVSDGSAAGTGPAEVQGQAIEGNDVSVTPVP